MVKTSWPRSPADSIIRSPAPTMRWKRLWWKERSLTRSRGISWPDLPRTPERRIRRSLVRTKWVVRQVTSLARNHRRASTRPPSRPSAALLRACPCRRFVIPRARAPASMRTPKLTGPEKYHQWGFMSKAISSPGFSSFLGKAIDGALQRCGAAAGAVGMPAMLAMGDVGHGLGIAGVQHGVEVLCEPLVGFEHDHERLLGQDEQLAVADGVCQAPVGRVQQQR